MHGRQRCPSHAAAAGPGLRLLHRMALLVDAIRSLPWHRRSVPVQPRATLAGIAEGGLLLIIAGVFDRPAPTRVRGANATRRRGPPGAVLDAPFSDRGLPLRPAAPGGSSPRRRLPLSCDNPTRPMPNCGSTATGSQAETVPPGVAWDGDRTGTRQRPGRCNASGSSRGLERRLSGDRRPLDPPLPVAGRGEQWRTAARPPAKRWRRPFAAGAEPIARPSLRRKHRRGRP